MKRNNYKASEIFLINGLLMKADEETIHLFLLRMYTEETFLFRILNKSLREKNIAKIFSMNLFPYYLFLQHSFFITFKDEGILSDIVQKKKN